MLKKQNKQEQQEFKISSGPVGTTSSLGSRVFDAINYTVITLAALITILPFFYIVGASFASEYELSVRPMFIIPQDVTLDAYKYIFSSNKLVQSFGNSVFITVVGTIINLFFTVTFAYPLSKKYLRARGFLLNMVIFSMFFSGGMIPSYILISNWLGMKNSYWSVLIPGAISAYNLMIVKNFFQGIPQELEESAHIDGCNDLGTLIKFVLPLSLPIIATLSLFYGVGYWNSYSNVIIQNTRSDMQTTQVIIRRMYESAQIDMEETITPPLEAIRAATVMFSTVPILCVYPFLQKHFAQGLMVGGVKG